MRINESGRSRRTANENDDNTGIQPAAPKPSTDRSRRHGKRARPAPRQRAKPTTSTFQIESRKDENGLTVFCPQALTGKGWALIVERLGKETEVIQWVPGSPISLNGVPDKVQALLQTLEDAMNFLEGRGVSREEACGLLSSDKLWNALKAAEPGSLEMHGGKLTQPQNIATLQGICLALVDCGRGQLALDLLMDAPARTCLECLTRGSVPRLLMHAPGTQRQLGKVALKAARAAAARGQWAKLSTCFDIAPAGMKARIAALLLPAAPDQMPTPELIGRLCRLAKVETKGEGEPRLELAMHMSVELFQSGSPDAARAPKLEQELLDTLAEWESLSPLLKGAEDDPQLVLDRCVNRAKTLRAFLAGNPQAGGSASSPSPRQRAQRLMEEAELTYQGTITHHLEAYGLTLAGNMDCLTFANPGTGKDLVPPAEAVEMLLKLGEFLLGSLDPGQAGFGLHLLESMARMLEHEESAWSKLPVGIGDRVKLLLTKSRGNPALAHASLGQLPGALQRFGECKNTMTASELRFLAARIIQQLARSRAEFANEGDALRALAGELLGAHSPQLLEAKSLADFKRLIADDPTTRDALELLARAGGNRLSELFPAIPKLGLSIAIIEVAPPYSVGGLQLAGEFMDFPWPIDSLTVTDHEAVIGAALRSNKLRKLLANKAGEQPDMRIQNIALSKVVGGCIVHCLGETFPKDRDPRERLEHFAAVVEFAFSSPSLSIVDLDEWSEMKILESLMRNLQDFEGLQPRLTDVQSGQWEALMAKVRVVPEIAGMLSIHPAEALARLSKMDNQLLRLVSSKVKEEDLTGAVAAAILRAVEAGDDAAVSLLLTNLRSYSRRTGRINELVRAIFRPLDEQVARLEPGTIQRWILVVMRSNLPSLLCAESVDSVLAAAPALARLDKNGLKSFFDELVAAALSGEAPVRERFIAMLIAGLKLARANWQAGEAGSVRLVSSLLAALRKMKPYMDNEGRRLYGEEAAFAKDKSVQKELKNA